MGQNSDPDPTCNVTTGLGEPDHLPRPGPGTLLNYSVSLFRQRCRLCRVKTVVSYLYFLVAQTRFGLTWLNLPVSTTLDLSEKEGKIKIGREIYLMTTTARLNMETAIALQLFRAVVKATEEINET